MKILKFLIFTFFLAGCGTTLTGYSFDIQAFYEAPNSEYQFQVSAKGKVPAGSDTSEKYEGHVIIEPLKDAGTTVRLQFSHETPFTYQIGESKVLPNDWNFREREAILKNILQQAGYSHLDENEIKESIQAFGGAFSGPKGVLLQGQTIYLKVIETKETGS